MTDCFLHASAQDLEFLRIAVVMGLVLGLGLGLTDLPVPDSFLLTCIGQFNLLPKCPRMQKPETLVSSNLLSYTAVHFSTLHLNKNVTKEIFTIFNIHYNFLT